MPQKSAPHNRTLSISPGERTSYTKDLHRTIPANECLEYEVVCGDSLMLSRELPRQTVDLVITDPPYNIEKQYGAKSWSRRPLSDYEEWLESWISELKRILKPEGSVYICSEWRSSPAVYNVLNKHFHIQNRITWEREKGRGAKRNWKNSSEDIWFATVKKASYTFNVDAVKLKRRVIAPYTDAKGKPKDWKRTKEGDFRLTHPSNLWTDISVPFWSMPENTPHPTQKPEKLIAKIILASSNPGDLIFDPFLGSGTTAVAATKLGRRCLGIELDEEYACYALKRLAIARENPRIQGYDGKVFYERNSGPITDQPDQSPAEGGSSDSPQQPGLWD